MDLPIYDFENDDKISEKRKEACRVNYQDMQIHHIDKIFTSTYVYDKKTGEPIAKKPKSLHELVWFMLQSQMAMSQKMLEMETDFENKINELIKSKRDW